MDNIPWKIELGLWHYRRFVGSCENRNCFTQWHLKHEESFFFFWTFPSGLFNFTAMEGNRACATSPCHCHHFVNSWSLMKDFQLDALAMLHHLIFFMHSLCCTNHILMSRKDWEGAPVTLSRHLRKIHFS